MLSRFNICQSRLVVVAVVTLLIASTTCFRQSSIFSPLFFPRPQSVRASRNAFKVCFMHYYTCYSALRFAHNKFKVNGNVESQAPQSGDQRTALPIWFTERMASSLNLDKYIPATYKLANAAPDVVSSSKELLRYQLLYCSN